MTGVANRRVLLTLLLIVLTATAALAFFAVVRVWHRLVFLYPLWAAYSFVAIAALRLFATIGVWFWSKSAVIAYALLACANAAICAAVGIFEASLFDLVGAALLLALLWHRLLQMPWGVLANNSLKRTAAETLRYPHA